MMTLSRNEVQHKRLDSADMTQLLIQMLASVSLLYFQVVQTKTAWESVGINLIHLTLQD